MAKNVINKKQNIGNYIILATIFIITTLEWHFADWYGRFTPYGTLITFMGLVIASLFYLNIKNTIKDPVFYLCIFTALFALFNILKIGSGKGCLLVVLDMLLILYLANKVSFTVIQKYIFLGYIAFFFFYWTIDVKGYFKGYNTNYGGLILISGFACLMIITEIAKEKIRSLNKKWAMILAYVAEFVFIVIGYSIISWYRSRTALMGYIILLLLKYLPLKFVTNKIMYCLFTMLGTIGGVIVPFVYIFLANFLNKLNVQLFYKDLVSGRELLWSELISAFLKTPITGIGSSYVVKTDFMNGMLEVHNGMLDILIVHGVVVFIPICLMLTKRLLDKRNFASDMNMNKIVFASIICMLVTSFFENFIIVQPFSLIIFCLIVLLNGDAQLQK